MKRLLLAFAILAMLCPTSIEAQKRLRATHISAADTVVSSNKDDAMEAYSDTVGYVQDSFGVAENDSDDNAVDSNSGIDSDDYEELSSIFDSIGSIGIGGMFIALLIVLLCLLFLATPFILIIFLLRYLWKSQNNKVILEKMRMEQHNYQASSTTDDVAKEDIKRTKKHFNIDNVYDEYMFRKGVLHISVGVGLALMFWLWDATALVGVGLLVACFGAGQVFISRTSINKGSRKGFDDDFDNDPSSDRQHQAE